MMLIQMGAPWPSILDSIMHTRSRFGTIMRSKTADPTGKTRLGTKGPRKKGGPNRDRMDACRARLACVIPARGRRTPVESPPAAGRLSMRIIPPSLRLAGLARLCGATGGGVEPFDAASFETERLRLDAEARRSMAEVFSRVAAEEGAVDGEDPRAWKWRIRKRIWDLMERENIARDPRPVHHRIPNFAGAATAASMVS